MSNVIENAVERATSAALNAAQSEPDPRRRAAMLRDVLTRLGVNREVDQDVRTLIRAGYAPDAALPVAVSGAFRRFLTQRAEGLSGRNRGRKEDGGGGHGRDRERDRGGREDGGGGHGRDRERDRGGRGGRDGRVAGQVFEAVGAGSAAIATAIGQSRAARAGVAPEADALAPTGAGYGTGYGTGLDVSVTGPGGMSVGAKIALGGGGLLLLLVLGYFLLVKPQQEKKASTGA
jgi:hypothetical protein